MESYNFCTPRSKKEMIYKEFFKRSKRVWLQKLDRRLGRMWIMKNNVSMLLISSQNLYFVDDDAIYEVIFQGPVCKWRHIYRHKISMDTFAESVLFQKYSIIFILRQVFIWANYFRGNNKQKNNII